MLHRLHDDSTFTEVTVDDVTLVKGGEAQTLTDDQAARLSALEGVKLEEQTGDGPKGPLLEDLKDQARDRGLPVSGTKDELTERIEDHDNDEGA